MSQGYQCNLCNRVFKNPVGHYCTGNTFKKTGFDWIDLSLPARKHSAPPVELSNREKEVLQLYAYGKHYQEIADELNVTLKTIEVHAHNMRKANNAVTTGYLACEAIRQGIIN